MALILNYDDVSANEIGLMLKRGDVGIFPCDTIYGICATVSEENAERIYQIKQRPQSKSFITLMTKDQLVSSDLIVPEDLLVRWPAAFTAILANKEGVTTAVRVPSDDFLLSLMEVSGPIYSTSVNISGQPSLQNSDDIISTFSSSVDFILEKKDLVPGMSSTLIDATKKPYRIIRQGAYEFS